MDIYVNFVLVNEGILIKKEIKECVFWKKSIILNIFLFDGSNLLYF